MIDLDFDNNWIDINKLIQQARYDYKNCMEMFAQIQKTQKAYELQDLEKVIILKREMKILSSHLDYIMVIYSWNEIDKWEAERMLEMKSEIEITTDVKWNEKRKNKYTEMEIRAIIDTEKIDRKIKVEQLKMTNKDIQANINYLDDLKFYMQRLFKIDETI